jgi:phospho-2-dehydro-3-deoxyheptonate aldolase
LKKIIKNREPKFLIEYKNKFSKEELKNFDLYNDFPYKTKENCEKDEKNLRKILLDEQGYICCYCMSRINCENSKIEHFKPQSKYKELQLDYKNLFIVMRTYFEKPRTTI